MFKNTSIRVRLLFGSVLFIVGLICIGLLGLLQSKIIAQKVDVIVNREFPQYVGISQAFQMILEQEITIRNHIISPYDASADRFQKIISDKRLAINGLLAEVSSALDSTETDIFNQFNKVWADYQKLQDRAITMAIANRNSEAMGVINGDGLTLFNQLSALYKTIGDQRISQSTDRGAEINDLVYNTVPLISLVIAISALIIVGMFSLWTIRSILKPLNTLLDTARNVGNGDLTQRAVIMGRNEIGTLAENFNQMVDNLQQRVEFETRAKTSLQTTISTYMNFVQKVASGDLRTRLELQQGMVDVDVDTDLHQLGQNLNAMADSLSDITQKIRESASGVAAAAAEIFAMSNQQIASATEQHAAVAETVATVEQIRVTVSQSSERAQAVAQTARQSLNVSHNGQQAVADTVHGMESVRQRVESIAQNILALSERTQQIGEIIATVNEIADQSKLLALNASIEAARAGEDGKGFAVVAMEVRQLAEQSREATARVRDILSEIQQATNTAVMVTEQGNKGAEQGMVLAEEAGKAISQLAEIIEDAAQAASQIAASSSQQSNGMNQLATAMAQIEQATRQTATSTVQTEKSTRDLNEMARRMQEAAARYQIADAV